MRHMSTPTDDISLAVGSIGARASASLLCAIRRPIHRLITRRTTDVAAHEREGHVMTRTSPMIWLAAVIAVLVAGCGDGGNDNNDNGSRATATPVATPVTT